jgi:hypothetical protein
MSVTNVGGTVVNYLDFIGSATGSGPALRVLGTDASADLNLAPKGTGKLRFGTLTATADAAVTGYITIKDAGGTTRKLAVIS